MELGADLTGQGLLGCGGRGPGGNFNLWLSEGKQKLVFGKGVVHNYDHFPDSGTSLSPFLFLKKIFFFFQNPFLYCWYTLWELFGQIIMKKKLEYFSKINRGIKFNLARICLPVWGGGFLLYSTSVGCIKHCMLSKFGRKRGRGGGSIIIMILLDDLYIVPCGQPTYYQSC